MLTHNFDLVFCDTDSISISKRDGAPFGPSERASLLAELNGMMPPMLRWDDDGYYSACVVAAAKNYLLVDEAGNRKIRGSALKATTKEKALKEFIAFALDFLVDKNVEAVIDMYDDYAREILSMTDISRWASKKTVTENVLNGERTNEARIRASIKDSEYRAGDKIFTYFDESGAVKLQENWSGDHDVDKLLEKLFKTALVFEEIIPKQRFTNYKLKKNKLALSALAS